MNVWFNHETHGNYTLQDGDDCILHTELVNDYADAETFAADCMAVMQAAQAENLGFTRYSFSTDEDTDDGISYYLDCVASYPAGLTAAQVAQRVQVSYHYDNNSFSSEADRMITSAVSCRMRFPTSTPTGTTVPIPTRNT